MAERSAWIWGTSPVPLRPLVRALGRALGGVRVRLLAELEPELETGVLWVCLPSTSVRRERDGREAVVAFAASCAGRLKVLLCDEPPAGVLCLDAREVPEDLWSCLDPSLVLRIGLVWPARTPLLWLAAGHLRARGALRWARRAAGPGLTVHHADQDAICRLASSEEAMIAELKRRGLRARRHRRAAGPRVPLPRARDRRAGRISLVAREIPGCPGLPILTLDAMLGRPAAGVPLLAAWSEEHPALRTLGSGLALHDQLGAHVLQAPADQAGSGGPALFGWASPVGTIDGPDGSWGVPADHPDRDRARAELEDFIGRSAGGELLMISGTASAGPTLRRMAVPAADRLPRILELVAGPNLTGPEFILVLVRLARASPVTASNRPG